MVKEAAEEVRVSDVVPEMVMKVAVAISGAPFPSVASIRKARAAIEAMREPTEAMLRAAADAHTGYFDQAHWHAAIDAALTDPKTKGSETP